MGWGPKVQSWLSHGISHGKGKSHGYHMGIRYHMGYHMGYHMRMGYPMGYHHMGYHHMGYHMGRGNQMGYHMGYYIGMGYHMGYYIRDVTISLTLLTSNKRRLNVMQSNHEDRRTGVPFLKLSGLISDGILLPAKVVFLFYIRQPKNIILSEYEKCMVPFWLSSLHKYINKYINK